MSSSSRGGSLIKKRRVDSKNTLILVSVAAGFKYISKSAKKHTRKTCYWRNRVLSLPHILVVVKGTSIFRINAPFLNQRPHFKAPPSTPKSCRLPTASLRMLVSNPFPCFHAKVSSVQHHWLTMSTSSRNLLPCIYWALSTVSAIQSLGSEFDITVFGISRGNAVVARVPSYEVPVISTLHWGQRQIHALDASCWVSSV